MQKHAKKSDDNFVKELEEDTVPELPPKPPSSLLKFKTLLKKFSFTGKKESAVVVSKVKKNVAWADSGSDLYSPQASGGKIRFVYEGMESGTNDSNFMMVYEDSAEQMESIANDMAGRCEMRTPKLVLTIISNVNHFKPWKRAQDVEDFQDGLMKAASLTDMWILTEGLNSGVTTIIGEAVAREKSRRKILETEQSLIRFLSAERLPKLTVIGLVSMENLAPNLAMDLTNAVKKDKETVTVELAGTDQEHGSRQLNPQMTDFFVMSDKMSPSAVSSFLLRMELRLMSPVGKTRRYMTTGDPDLKEAGTTPLVGLLVQGGPDEIDRVLALLRKNVPIVVICGQGKIADLLAFAYRASQESYDTDNYEAYVKTELLRRVGEVFPEEFRENPLARNLCRDRILQCVSTATQGDNHLLTLVDRNLQSYELKNLSKVILYAVLSSSSAQGQELQREQIQWNLQLTIDWIRPDLALTEIFYKYSFHKITLREGQFQQALIRPDREEFVDLFLDRGFVLHQYLSHRRLEMLFERCHDKAFFVGICLETILGERVSLNHPISENFVSGVDCALNKLLHILTGMSNLINPLELSLNSSKDRVETPVLAEQRALQALLYWAALTNNIKLARLLWCRVNEPMAMALVLSTLFSRLSRTWISDHDLKLKTKKYGIEFGQLAVKMLDLNFQESKVQAIRCLTSQQPEFNNFAVMDLAMIGKNKFFIAHPCFQKHIYSLWYGRIRIREHANQSIHLPDNIKILLCLVFIFPIYHWIDIVQDYKIDTGKWRRIDSAESIASTGKQHSCECLLLKKIFFLWTAPVTKFWIFQTFYVSFLTLFAYSLLLPFCGNHQVNLVVIGFIIILFCDMLYISIIRKLHCNEVSVIGNVRCMLCFISTASVVFIFRVINSEVISFPRVKIILSFSLIYFFYSEMGFLFPVSQTLGPMLVNITVMMRRDLIKFLKIWFLTLMSGIVTIHAVLYPAYPFNWEGVSTAVLRGIFGLFMTQINDLEGYSCSCLYNYTSVQGCHSEVLNQLETCPYSSYGGYFIVLQYIFITKLVYNTLIFAICSTTMARTYEKSVEIWKYQFFILVLEYAKRPPLPVPFVVLLYPFIIVRCCYKAALHFCLTLCPCCSKKEQQIQAGSYNMWRAFMKIHKKQEKLRLEKLSLNKVTEARLKSLTKDQNALGKQVDNLNDRLVGVINSQTNVALMLENMKHVLNDMAQKRSNAQQDGYVPPRGNHTNCRRSPYPGTSIRRFPVFDKNVSWEESYPNYDPGVYSRPIEEYEEELRPFVDPDMFEVLRQREERQKLDPDELENVPQLPEFLPEYNVLTEAISSTDEKFFVDRTSWMVKDDQPVQYSLDLAGVPRNPSGRTGMRGRGNLWRWGPNHVMYAIVSRWRSVYNSAGVMQGPMLVNGKRIMEILVVHKEMLHEDSLPGAFVSGRTSKYSVMCEMFMKDILGEKDAPGSPNLDQDDMTQFFRQFVSSDFVISGILNRSVAASSSFSSNLIYQGYMDDMNNTDNAWVEAEIWNFHYHSNNKFDKKIREREKHWREVSSLMQLTSSQVQYVMEVARSFDTT